MNRLLIALFLVSALLASAALAQHPASDWKSRTIYQLLTDRFATSSSAAAAAPAAAAATTTTLTESLLSNASTEASGCSDLGNYCGGTFQGIIDHLDYITGMGFDAIWISPVLTNTPRGYHGYWAQDFDTINSHFGSSDDLKKLVAAAHAKDVWVMVDIVLNHVGPVGSDFGSIKPFNTGSDYHPDCAVSEYTCFTNEVLTCRLSSLPDLDQSNVGVAQQLVNYGTGLIQEYQIDGFRADTVMYIAQDFWQTFSKAVGVYIVGEVWSDVSCGVAYQKQGVDGVLNYPLYYAIVNAFQGQQSMTALASAVEALSNYPDPDLLGTFVDNHDNPRFLNNNDNKGPQYQNALTFVLMSQGIPIIYYGTEQLFDGGNDPYNREPLWPSNYNTQSETYQFISRVVSIRKKYTVWNYAPKQSYSDDNVYVFYRGNVLVALTNNDGVYTVQITQQPFSDNTRICNLLDLSGSDCVTVQNGQFSITLGSGYGKIYAAAS